MAGNDRKLTLIRRRRRLFIIIIGAGRARHRGRRLADEHLRAQAGGAKSVLPRGRADRRHG